MELKFDKEGWTEYGKQWFNELFEAELKKRYEVKKNVLIHDYIANHDGCVATLITSGIPQTVLIPRKAEQSTADQWNKISETIE